MELGKKFIQSIIKYAIENAISGNRTLQELRKYGVRIRTQTFYQLWNEEKKAIEVEQLLPKLDPFKPIPDRLHVRTTDRIPTKYYYLVEAQDRLTGTIRLFGVYTDIRLAPNEVKQKAMEMALATYGLPDPELKIKSAVKRKR